MIHLKLENSIARKPTLPSFPQSREGAFLCISAACASWRMHFTLRALEEGSRLHHISASLWEVLLIPNCLMDDGSMQSLPGSGPLPILKQPGSSCLSITLNYLVSCHFFGVFLNLGVE